MTRPAGEWRSRGLLCLLAVLVCATAVVLTVDPGRPPGPAAASFQHLVGGLGGGPAVGPGGCLAGFDPRLEGTCSAGLGPVPGGACFCGRHTGLLSYPPGGGGGHSPVD